MKVRCKNSCKGTYTRITKGKEYEVVREDLCYYHIINDVNNGFDYSKQLFEIVGEDEVLRKAINHYGEVPQLYQTIEEMAELTQAISKYVRNRDGVAKEKFYKGNILEEIADVEIMLEQCKIILEIKEEDIKDFKDYKIRRLNKRINKATGVVENE